MILDFRVLPKSDFPKKPFLKSRLVKSVPVRKKAGFFVIISEKAYHVQRFGEKNKKSTQILMWGG